MKTSLAALDDFLYGGKALSWSNGELLTVTLKNDMLMLILQVSISIEMPKEVCNRDRVVKNND